MQKVWIKYSTYILIISLFFILRNSSLAFGGYTHYYICSKVVCGEENFKNLSEEEKLAYKSGAVMADVGRFYFDDFFPASDEETFKNELINISLKSDDKKLKLFALGWSDHVIQDRHVSEVFGRLFKRITNYRIGCGKCDSYVYGDVGYLSEDKLFSPYSMIKQTYNKFTIKNIPLKVKNKTIKKEVFKILMAFYAQSWLGMMGLSVEESQIAEKEFKNLALLCGTHNPDYKILFPDN